VDASSTRLEVTEGKVKLSNVSDKKSIEVTSGYFAIAATGMKLEAKPIPKMETILNFDFEDGLRPTRLKNGEVVPGPPRKGNRFCVAGIEKFDPGGLRQKEVMFVQEPPQPYELLSYKPGMRVQFDCWFTSRSGPLFLGCWNNDQRKPFSLAVDKF